MKVISSRLNRAIGKVTEIEKANRLLFERMYKIMRTQRSEVRNIPTIFNSKEASDYNHSPRLDKPTKSGSYKFKQSQKVIHNENIKFLDKLMSQKSHFDNELLAEKRENEEKLLRKLCRFPHIFSSSGKEKSPSKRERRIQEFQRFNSNLLKKLNVSSITPQIVE